ncbi:hypothetical protein U1Q18_039242 [Sarracenia purpurea var. burkii]
MEKEGFPLDVTMSGDFSAGHEARQAAMSMKLIRGSGDVDLASSGVVSPEKEGFPMRFVSEELALCRKSSEEDLAQTPTRGR